jgi:hypothetical protein
MIVVAQPDAAAPTPVGKSTTAKGRVAVASGEWRPLLT